MDRAAQIVEGVIRLLRGPPPKGVVGSKVYNIGSSASVDLMHFIVTIEKLLGKKAETEMLPMQRCDVPATFADVANLERDITSAATPLEEELRQLVEWYWEFDRV